MAGMVAAHTRQRTRGQREPGIAAGMSTPVLAYGPLALLAVIESAIRSALTGVSVQRAVVLSVVGCATTLPPALLAPAAATATVTAACVASLLLFHTLTVAGLLAQLIAGYRLARSSSARPGAQALAVGLPFVFLVVLLGHPVPRSSEAGVLSVLLACLAPAAAFAGIAQAARAEAQTNAAVRRAAAGDLLEHAARGERARIARELHDVVAHHISMISVQAETARLTTPGMPGAGADRLVAIGDTARAALTEMRRLLGVLREDADVNVPDLRPQPGLEQLNELLDETRDASGSAARLILTGPPAQLGPGVELAAYRIVQEALTNTRRHAPGAAVDVELRYGDTSLKLLIRDNGPGPPGDEALAGHGLTGMRERAAAVGGALRGGPAASGGFLVEATLPSNRTEAIT
jgi:signal transduction histidine kinase